ncbi:Prephenate dehydratase-domain-containing protein [Gautieria morchelliformis]|nr:Prephenate dehydratase-domain-containing protein [Gautieria morchelliformis]
MEDVRRVMSHEQALGQCKGYLEQHVPGAALVRVASTAGAAQMLAASDSRCTDAAVCSKICANIYEGLDVLAEGIQDENSNSTRFMVMATDKEAVLPGFDGTARWRGLIRVGSRHGCAVGAVLDDARLRIRQVDRRPSLSVAGNDYFVEVEADCECEEDAWEAMVRAASERMHGRVLGVWK